MDPVYDPARVELKIPSLTTLLADCTMAEKLVTDKKIAYNRTAADRKSVFSDLGPLTTQCLAVLKASGVLPEVFQMAKTLANKVRGVDGRKKQKSRQEETDTEETTEEMNVTPEDTGEADVPAIDKEVADEVKRYSVMQMSFVMRAENFGKLVALLKMEPLYQPSNDLLKIPALETLHTQLVQANEDVSTPFQMYKNALVVRNQLFYAEKTGLVNIAFKVKDIVKGDYGVKSDAYRSIKGLPFKRLPKPRKKKVVNG